MITLSKNGIQREFDSFLFDMDGVVTDSMPWHYQCWEQVLKNRGIIIDHQDIYSREGEKGLISILNIFKEKGVSISNDEGLQVLREKEELFRRIARIKLFPGIPGFIKMLKSTGCRIALVTGTSKQEMEKILPGDLKESFNVFVTGDLVKKGKPEPDPYLKALEGLGASANHAIAIENAPLGIRSAKRAGLFTVAIATSMESSFLNEADLITENHDSFYKLWKT